MSNNITDNNLITIFYEVFVFIILFIFCSFIYIINNTILYSIRNFYYYLGACILAVFPVLEKLQQSREL